MIDPLKWLNNVVLALVGMSETKVRNDASLEFRIADKVSRNDLTDGRSLYANWLTDTVSYYH